MLALSGMSERRACRLAGLSRDAYRHPPSPSADTQALQARLAAPAQERRRFGYRRLHDLLRLEFPHVNHKKIYRLYREANLAARRKMQAQTPRHGAPVTAAGVISHRGVEYGFRQ